MTLNLSSSLPNVQLSPKVSKLLLPFQGNQRDLVSITINRDKICMQPLFNQVELLRQVLATDFFLDSWHALL